MEDRAAPGSQPGGPRPPLRILVVDDDRDGAESLGKLLALGGHRIALSFDAQDCLERARSFAPRVIICDIGLSGSCDGYDLARRLRADPALGRLSLIAVTGYGGEAERALSRDAGFDLHLTKPVDLAALHAALEECAARPA